MAGLAFAEPESAPEAEADPAADAWYGYYGHGYGYGHRYYGGYGGYYGHPYGYGYYRGKRDAAADPAVLASSSALTAPQLVNPYITYAGHHAVNPYVAPVVYAGHHTVGPVLADPRVYHAGKCFLHEFSLHIFHNFYKPCLFYLLFLQMLLKI